MTSKPTLAFVTTCKGRLHHLQQTLPLMAAERPDELIVVDYDSPDGAGDWVAANFPEATVVRASQPDGGFNVGRARNLGAAAAAGEWLFFVDADIGLAPGMAETLRSQLAAGNFYRPQPKRARLSSQVYGSFCCRAADFAAIGGYDEVIEGWGGEDQDLYERLRLLGLEQAFYSPDLLLPIGHDDAERHVLPDMRNRWENEAVNACYSQAKRAISSHRGGKGDLPLDERRKLLAAIRPIVGKWFDGGARGALPMRFVVAQGPPHGLASRLRARSETAVTVVLEPPPQR